MRRISALLAIVFVVATLLSSCAKKERSLTTGELLDLGEKYLLELNYEQALVQFNKVIEIEPRNVRAYIGAAEVYMSMSDVEKAISVLTQGLEQLPENGDIKNMLDSINALLAADEPEEEIPEEPDNPLAESETSLLSVAEIAEQKPWRLFENPLLANEVKFADVDFMGCTLEDVKSYYPGGYYIYRNAEGKVIHTDSEGKESVSSGNGVFNWDTSYDNFEIQYSTEGSSKYAGFRGDSEIRGISVGMGFEEALNALGLSPEGIAFVKESRHVSFRMNESECYQAIVRDSGYDDYQVYYAYYDATDNWYMTFIVSIKDKVVRNIEIVS